MKRGVRASPGALSAACRRIYPASRGARLFFRPSGSTLASTPPRAAAYKTPCEHTPAAEVFRTAARCTAKRCAAAQKKSSQRAPETRGAKITTTTTATRGRGGGGERGRGGGRGRRRRDGNRKIAAGDGAAARGGGASGARGWITKVARLLTKPRLGAVGRSAARARTGLPQAL